MSSASGGGDFVPIPPTGFVPRSTPSLGFAPGLQGDFSLPAPDLLFCGVQKILRLYSDRPTVVA